MSHGSFKQLLWQLPEAASWVTALMLARQSLFSFYFQHLWYTTKPNKGLQLLLEYFNITAELQTASNIWWQLDLQLWKFRLEIQNVPHVLNFNLVFGTNKRNFSSWSNIFLWNIRMMQLRKGQSTKTINLQVKFYSWKKLKVFLKTQKACEAFWGLLA